MKTDSLGATHARFYFAHTVRLVCAGVLLAALSGAAFAQPSKTIRILVGFPPGGGTDAIARALAEKLKDELGTSVIVENRPGAGGQIAAHALKSAAPDGTTFFISHDHTISILPLVMKNPGFDPAKDFVPVAGFATFVNALALSAGTSAKNFKDYVAWVKSQGGKSAIGIPAPASVPEFLVKSHRRKVRPRSRVRSVPRQRADDRRHAQQSDPRRSRLRARFHREPRVRQNPRRCRVGGARQAALPDVPTFAELGLAGFEACHRTGCSRPPALRRPRSNNSRSPVQGARQARGARSADTLALTVQFMPQSQLASRERAYSQTWAQIIKKSGFQPQ